MEMDRDSNILSIAKIITQTLIHTSSKLSYQLNLLFLSDICNSLYQMYMSAHDYGAASAHKVITVFKTYIYIL